MSRIMMNRRLVAAAILIAWGLGLQSSRSTAGFPMKLPCLNQTGCGICCPVCDHVCKLEAEQVEAEIPCFDVESKLICIPRVVFPWQKKKLLSCDTCDGVGCTNCVHNGARVRRICVLKTDSIKCPKCKYTWSTAKKCDGCDGGCDACCDGGCGVPSCDGCFSDGAVTLPPAFNSARAYVPGESKQIGATPGQSFDIVRPVHATK